MRFMSLSLCILSFSSLAMYDLNNKDKISHYKPDVVIKHYEHALTEAEFNDILNEALEILEIRDKRNVSMISKLFATYHNHCPERHKNNLVSGFVMFYHKTEGEEKRTKGEEKSTTGALSQKLQN